MSAQRVDLPNLMKIGSVVAALRMRGFSHGLHGIISECHSEHYTGILQGSRGDEAGQGQTGEASSGKIFKQRDSPGKRRR